MLRQIVGKAFARLRQARKPGLRSNSNRVEKLNDWANALQDQGRLDEAAAKYRLVLRLDPDSVPAHNKLGNVLIDQGRFG